MTDPLDKNPPTAAIATQVVVVTKIEQKSATIRRVILGFAPGRCGTLQKNTSAAHRALLPLHLCPR